MTLCFFRRSPCSRSYRRPGEPERSALTLVAGRAGRPARVPAARRRAARHSYSRTPSFTWLPVDQHGGHYKFELATSRAFEDSSIVFKDTNVSLPAETISRQLPWMTGTPYALWAHVRWVSKNGSKATRWSKPFGFNMSWRNQDVPQQLRPPRGLVRWKPIEGATEYEVLYPDLVPARVVRDDDERCGRAGVLHLPQRARRPADPLARPGYPHARPTKWLYKRTAGRLVRAVEPRLHDRQPPPAAPVKLAPTATVSDTWDTGKKGVRPTS